MDAGFVRSDKIAAVPIMKDPDTSGMSTAQDLHHSPFGARRRTGGLTSPGVAPLDASDNPVSVHRIAQLVRRNEEIAIKVLSWRLGNHKAVSIAMCDHPSGEQIGIARCRPRRRRKPDVRFCGGTRLRPRAREAILVASQLFYEAFAL